MYFCMNVYAYIMCVLGRDVETEAPLSKLVDLRLAMPVGSQLYGHTVKSLALGSSAYVSAGSPGAESPRIESQAYRLKTDFREHHFL